MLRVEVRADIVELGSSLAWLELRARGWFGESDAGKVELELYSHREARRHSLDDPECPCPCLTTISTIH
jgi:hypothetical protein